MVALVIAAPHPTRPDGAALDQSEAAERVRRHTEIILGKREQAERRVVRILEQARRDATAELYDCHGGRCPGAERHPWLKARPETGGNPRTLFDYLADSYRMTDGVQNRRQLYSCFEPQLVAKGWWWTEPDVVAPGSEDLARSCKQSCPSLTFADNGYEVIQFWIPEHQVAVNNYARSRFDPTAVGPSGRKFARAELLRRKRQVPERLIKRAIDRDIPLGGARAEEPDRAEPYIGQGHWGGVVWDYQDRRFAHVYRTAYAQALANRRPDGALGWLLEPRSIYDTFPPRTSEKPILNIWTEYGMVDAVTSVSSFSYFLGGRGRAAMEALFGGWRPYTERAAEPVGFWQRQGAAAYRVGRWGRRFGPLQATVGISPDRNPVLREVVYLGGHELFPLTMTLEGFETPELSAAAVFARRALHIAGSPETRWLLPDGERGRAVEYTIDADDRSREVDKLQLIFPTNDRRPSECFRSQRIPNMTDQTLDRWAERNLPHDLVGYVKEHFGDVAFGYWNKRVACTCRIAGLPHGAWVMDFPRDELGPGRGSGDRPYGRVEKNLCTYAEGELPSAFAGRDTRPCTENPNREHYEGIDDNV